MSGAVGDDARPEQIVAKLGVAHNGAAVGAVPERKTNASGFQCPEHGFKLPVLGEGIGAAALADLVGNGEVGENPFRFQAGHCADPADGLQRAGELLLPAEKAQTGHAGVQLDMDFDPSAQPFCLPGERKSGFFAPYRLGDAVSQELARLLRRGQAQLQNGQADAGAADLPGLVDTGYGQIGRAQLFQGPGDLNGSVAVGVRLYHA